MSSVEEVFVESTKNLPAHNPSASDGHGEHRAASLAQPAAAASFAPSHRLGTPSIALASEKLSTANLASVQMHFARRCCVAPAIESAASAA